LKNNLKQYSPHFRWHKSIQALSELTSDSREYADATCGSLGNVHMAEV